MTHLGALIADDGRIGSELARRLGAASADFRALSRIWRHSSLSRTRKLELFNATIVPKLTYGLATAWLNVPERRRLNGFHCRCLRSIWGIKPAYVSRISNKTVLEKTVQKPVSHALAKQQLLMFGKVARAPTGSALRDSAFCPHTLSPATEKFVRKRGRPRQEWTAGVLKLAERVAGSFNRVHYEVTSESGWSKIVTSFCTDHLLA